MDTNNWSTHNMFRSNTLYERRMKYIEYALILIASLFFLLAITFIGTNDKEPDTQTILYCREDAAKEVLVYKDTEFSQFDFYQSCIENLTRTSPVTRENKWDQLLNRRTQ